MRDLGKVTEQNYKELAAKFVARVREFNDLSPTMQGWLEWAHEQGVYVRVRLRCGAVVSGKIWSLDPLVLGADANISLPVNIEIVASPDDIAGLDLTF